MGEITSHLNLRGGLAAKTLLRWNKNYFEWIEKYLGEPSEYGEGLKMAWSCEDRKVIYFPEFMTIQLHERIDEIRWKLKGVKRYPMKKEIESYAIWLKGKTYVAAD